MANSNKMDMSLDDIIQMDRKSGRGGGQFGGRRGRSRGAGGGRGRGLGGGQRNFGVARGGVENRRYSRPPMPYNRPETLPDRWAHDMYQGGGRPAGGRGSSNPPVRGSGGMKEGTLLISNLEFGVNDSDIKELFSEFGFLKQAAVHYDRSGRSIGTAEVIFENNEDAVKAMKQYNNVPLDGQPMKIVLVGGDQQKPERTMSSRIGPVSQFSGPPRSNRGGYQPQRGFGRSGGGARGGFGGRNRGGSGGGRGGGRNNERANLSKEDLDAQLDAYNSKMQVE